MKTRKLGNSGLEITAIGLGTWAIGGPWEYGWGPQEDSDSLESIYEAIDEGVNWIDTAPIYGLGHSEEIVGKALKEMTEKPIIATKCGLRWDEKHDRIPCLDPASIREECENSLKRLGVDVIDLYQIHHPMKGDIAVEAWAQIADLIKQGKVRYGGVSNFDVELMKKCNEIHPITSLQPQYNMLARGIEDEIMPYCGENNIGMIVYSPIARGILTGKYDKQKVENLPDDDSRHKSPLFNEPKLSKSLELVDKLKPIADGLGITLAQLAIAWALAKNEVTSAIVGARRPGQIVETAKAGEIELGHDVVNEINDLISEMKV